MDKGIDGGEKKAWGEAFVLERWPNLADSLKHQGSVLRIVSEAYEAEPYTESPSNKPDFSSLTCLKPSHRAYFYASVISGQKRARGPGGAQDKSGWQLLAWHILKRRGHQTAINES